jgi:uncharacterized protein (DUF58 family)
MTTAELAKKVRYIEITTKKAVTATFAGEYKSAFKGRGMEFDEVREYQSGDDIRTIDWNVTARTGKLHTKRFMEERELTLIFLVDLSASGSFGSGRQSKRELAAEICALLAFSAIKNNDRVGLIIFTDDVEMYIPPRKGSTHVLRLIRELLAFKLDDPGPASTNIGFALDSFSRLFKRKAVVFLISDFLDHGYEHQLKVVGRRHDLIAVSLSDPREYTLPRVGIVELEDAETGEHFLLDTDSEEARDVYRAVWTKKEDSLQSLCSGAGIDHVCIFSGEDYVRPLARFFIERERRFKIRSR